MTSAMAKCLIMKVPKVLLHSIPWFTYNVVAVGTPQLPCHGVQQRHYNGEDHIHDKPLLKKCAHCLTILCSLAYSCGMNKTFEMTCYASEIIIRSCVTTNWMNDGWMLLSRHMLTQCCKVRLMPQSCNSPRPTRWGVWCHLWYYYQPAAQNRSVTSNYNKRRFVRERGTRRVTCLLCPPCQCVFCSFILV